MKLAAFVRMTVLAGVLAALAAPGLSQAASLHFAVARVRRSHAGRW